MPSDPTDWKEPLGRLAHEPTPQQMVNTFQRHGDRLAVLESSHLDLIAGQSATADEMAVLKELVGALSLQLTETRRQVAALQDRTPYCSLCGGRHTVRVSCAEHRQYVEKFFPVAER